jgi:hypothetical protein
MPIPNICHPQERLETSKLKASELFAFDGEVDVYDEQVNSSSVNLELSGDLGEGGWVKS